MKSFASLIALGASLAGLALGQRCEHQWDGPFADHEIDGVPHLQARQGTSPPPLEIRPLIVDGPTSNRVDFMFLGDGYTQGEKDKFFADAMRLAQNMTDGQTFADVLPLMNFWAGFSPSTQSGIGVGGKARDTVYGLYRDGTELRGVYYKNDRVARAACQSTKMCDYPILLGNDPLYGGLGGAFTVTTASEANGALVLRHELGHSIIGVGEEYDGGQVYDGVNSAKSLDSIPWAHWYTDETQEPKVERSNMPIQAYPWTLLNVTSPWHATFNAAGTYKSHMLQFSVSGMTSSSDLVVELDGVKVNWQINSAVGVDRWIYNLPFPDKALKGGSHTVSFKLTNSKIQGTAQLCNLEILEYGAKDEFNFTPEFHGVYPTWDRNNQTTYRPTNDKCLMRTMSSVDFCDPCKEGLWLSLIQPLQLVDNITQVAQSDGSVEVNLDLLDLAQFRKIPLTTGAKEAYTISWYGDDTNQVLPQWTNSTTARIAPGVKEFGVKIAFSTTQVRRDRFGFMNFEKRYTVAKGRQ